VKIATLHLEFTIKLKEILLNLIIIMFHIIEFDNIDSKETKQLKYELAEYPNGTILTYSQYIQVPNLPNNKWIVWIDKDRLYNYDEQYKNFLKLKGIKNVIELDIKKSPYDDSWKRDDNYITSIFAAYI
jgi:hypothetical protein